MDRQYVNSSMITSIGYDAINSILEIEFKSDGAVWQYFDVAENVFKDFIGSGSHGRFWHAYIKNQYGESRVG